MPFTFSTLMLLVLEFLSRFYDGGSQSLVPHAPPFDFPTRAKRLACSSPQTKIARLSASGFLFLWRWGESNPRANEMFV